MTDRLLRLALVVLTAGGLAACEEDTEIPQGETSTIHVNVFVEADGTAGLSAGDDPLEGATVTLESTETDLTLTETTGSDGVATFSAVPAGVYTVTHTLAAPINSATLTGSTEQTIVAQFEGGTGSASFVYSYNPGAILGQFYRDEDDNDIYDPAVDTTLGGFQVVLTGTGVTDTVTNGDDGRFEFTGLARGSYTLTIIPLLGTEVADSTLDVVVSAGDTTDVLIEFTGGEAVSTIAAARALPVGSNVTIEGVVTAGRGVYNSTTFYLQDPTAGIVAFVGSGGPSVNVAMGDSVRISGSIATFSNELQIAGGSAMEVEILGRVPVPAARTVTATDVNAGSFQGELVVANAVTIDSVPSSGTNYNIRVSDATGSFIVFIDADAGITPSTFAVGQTMNITGIMTTFNTLREIKPRSQADLVLTSNAGGVQPIARARLLPNGQTVSVTGVVTAAPGTFNSTSVYIQDNSGAGIVLFTGSGGPNVSALVVGDSVNVTGVMGTFSAERQIAGGAALTVTDVGNGTVPTPLNIDAADVNAARFQGRLAAADSVRVVSVSGTTNLTVTVEDAFGQFVIFSDVDTGLNASNWTVGNSYRVVGVLSSFQSGSNPPLYQLKPRGAADVTPR